MNKILVSLTVFFLVSCSSKVTTVTIDNVKSFYSTLVQNRDCDLEPFGSLVLTGNTRVELTNGSYTIKIIAPKAAKYNYYNNLVDKVLYVNGDDGGDSRNVIKISAPSLSNITVTDNVILTAKNFKTSGLTIVAKNQGAINLQGQLKLDRLSQLGRGEITISWVDSEELCLDSSGDGPIYLAGAVDKMTIKLMQEAKLNVRYLRAKKAAVFTTDSAVAHVLVVNDLDAFAINKSDIYYYKRPKKLTVVTKDSANILQTAWMR